MSFSRADESPARRAAKVRISSCGLSGRGETARFQMERKHEEFGCKKLQQGQQHTEHLQNRSPIQYERGKRVQNRFLLVEKGSLWQDEYMTGEQSYHYYNEFLWPDRYADCVPMDKALELLKK